METSKANGILSQYKEYIPSDKVLALKNKLESANDSVYDSLVTLNMKNPTTTILLSVFLGAFGVDRFYIGDTGLGIAKLLFGWFTFGIWPLLDIFCCYKKTKVKNFNEILEIL